MKKWIVCLIAVTLLTGCSTAVKQEIMNRQVSERGEALITQTNEYISEEEAKRIAYECVGITEDVINRCDLKLEYEDDTGRAEYDIVIYTRGVEYELTLDAITGNVLEFEKERDRD